MLNTSLIATRAAGACALALALLAPAQALPVVEMAAAASASGFDLTVSARDVLDLHAYQFTLNFDPALLSAASVAEGSLLAGAGATYFFPGMIDNTAGSISFVAGGMVGPLAGVDGSGALARFSFGVQQAGMASFRLSDVVLLDRAGNDITADVRGLVTAVPEPASLALFGLGLVAVLGAGRFKRRAGSAVQAS